MRLGRIQGFNLSGAHDRAVKGGHLDMSFAVLELVIQAPAIGYPFRLVESGIEVSGFHLGVHEETAPGCMVGLQGTSNEEWSCNVRSVIMCAQSWRSSITANPNEKKPTWTLYAMLDTGDEQLQKPDWRDQNLARAQASLAMWTLASFEFRHAENAFCMAGLFAKNMTKKMCVLELILPAEDIPRAKEAQLIGCVCFSCPFANSHHGEGQPGQVFNLSLDSFSKVNAPVDFIIARRADDVAAPTADIGKILMRMAVQAGTYIGNNAWDGLSKQQSLADIVQPQAQARIAKKASELEDEVLRAEERLAGLKDKLEIMKSAEESKPLQGQKRPRVEVE
ncbi:unnamed protein product [Symbiodinium sp. CCMP2592]|nr:unnamed protein product [Symbiodinium sp. CCMP2592]